MAVVAVGCLAAGLGLSRFLVSPGKAAADARPPQAGPITVPVERRVIATDVVLRGDVAYDDPVTLRVETGDLGGPAVVTGQVPELGASLQAGSVALEIVGRPVVVLPGDLPTYRTLRSGVSGPDVRQLKAALASLGIDAGEGDTYDARAAAGVRALYQRVGYEPPLAGEELSEAARSARDAVRGAQDGLAAAQRELTSAGSGPAGSTLVRLDTAVAVARQTLTDTQEHCADPTKDEPCDRVAVLQAQGDLDQAVAERAEADVRPDTSAQRAAVASAQQALDSARSDLADAEAAVLTPLPASEVVFVPSLPRRVDTVAVPRGGTVQGELMTVSGATLQVTASASRADAELLTVGTAGTLTLGDTELPVTVGALRDPSAAGGGATGSATGDASDGGTDGGGPSGAAATPKGGRRTVVFTWGDLTPEQVAALQDSNVRIRIPVSSTDGEVLAVPLAALTAGPGGESRVEVARKGGATALVTVTTGLAADGYVEVSAAGTELAAGDLVVVGTAGEDEGKDEGKDGGNGPSGKPSDDGQDA